MTKIIEAKTTLHLKAFLVPGHVGIALDVTQSPDVSTTVLPVKILDDNALEALAQQWLDDLYELADKKNPFYLTPKP